jgi:hypothetical protein
MEQKHPTLPENKIQNSTISGKSDIDTSFWDAQEPILEHYQEKGTTVNSVCYSEILQDQLKSAI